jgi:hypothetical protein
MDILCFGFCGFTIEVIIELLIEQETAIFLHIQRINRTKTWFECVTRLIANILRQQVLLISGVFEVSWDSTKQPSLKQIQFHVHHSLKSFKQLPSNIHTTCDIHPQLRNHSRVHCATPMILPKASTWSERACAFCWCRASLYAKKSLPHI